MYQTGLFKAIRYFGTQQKLAHAISVSQQAVSQWLCREQKIPYAQVVKIVDATQGFVTLQELAPEEKTANRAVHRLMQRHPSSLVEIPIALIDIGKQCCPIFQDGDNLLELITEEECMQPVWVDNYNQLMTCECRVRAQRLYGKKIIMSYIVNLEAILSGESSITADMLTLPISEKVAVVAALAATAGQRRGRPRYKEISPKWDELSGRMDTFGAKLLGFVLNVN